MPKTIRNKTDPLNIFYQETKQFEFEVGIDEAGRGPMFGRVYAAAVILPKGNEFKFHEMKDSKRFYSDKKLIETADYIKENSLCWSVKYTDEKVIDAINIRQATLNTMHQCIKDIYVKLKSIEGYNKISLLLVDGNDFKPFMFFDISNNAYEQLNHVCVEGGDNKYVSIAAASILAKVERDRYIKDMCVKHPELVERYKLDKNKGYGTKNHIDGINMYGISKWHRKTYGICKKYA